MLRGSFEKAASLYLFFEEFLPSVYKKIILQNPQDYCFSTPVNNSSIVLQTEEIKRSIALFTFNELDCEATSGATNCSYLRLKSRSVGQDL